MIICSKNQEMGTLGGKEFLRHDLEQEKAVGHSRGADLSRLPFLFAAQFFRRDALGRIQQPAQGKPLYPGVKI
jgi:hypothetical protein